MARSKKRSATAAAMEDTDPVRDEQQVPAVVEKKQKMEKKEKKEKKEQKQKKEKKEEVVETEAEEQPQEETTAEKKDKKQKKKKKSATSPEETTEISLTVTKAVAVTAGAISGSSFADIFAQSAAVFGKKESYARADEDVLEENATAPSDDASGDVGPPTGEEQPATKKKEKKKKKHKRVKAEEEAAAAAAAAAALENGTATGDGAEGAEATLVEGEQATTTDEADSGEDKSDRTVFVGNVSLEATSKDIKQHFASCGKVESVRLRFLPVAGTAVNEHGNQKLMMKVCANKKLFTDQRDFCHAYVTFESASSVDAALQLNQSTLLTKSIRVDRENPQVDPQRSVFVGNLSFKITDDLVWKYFAKQLRTEEEMQPVENVRLIRDRVTGMGKGFGYVLLKTKSLAAKALSLDGRKLGIRELRVQVCGKRTKNKKGDEVEAKAKHEGKRSTPGAASRIAYKRKALGVMVDAPGAAKRKGNDKKTSPTEGAEPKRSSWKKDAPSRGSKPARASSSKKVSGKHPHDTAKSSSASNPKAKKPKHAARKARQAAEAKAQKSKASA